MKLPEFYLVGLLMVATAHMRAASSDASPARLMTPAEFQALPSKPADARISCGDDPNQFGELRVPGGLFMPSPLPVTAVVNLAGPPDLARYWAVAKSPCKPEVIETLLGGRPDRIPQRHGQVSAARLQPVSIPQVLVWGQRDDMNPILLGEEFAQAAIRAGGAVRLVTFPELGHFEIASPRSSSWPALEREFSLC